VHGEPEELFDLLTDPAESKNLVASQPRIANDLRNRLEKFSRTFNHEESTPDDDTIYGEDMEKVEERLRRLGYM
jgi:hypothetical protein